MNKCADAQITDEPIDVGTVEMFKWLWEFKRREKQNADQVQLRKETWAQAKEAASNMRKNGFKEGVVACEPSQSQSSRSRRRQTK